MHSTNDLDTVQHKLDERGLCDVKFFFANLNSMPSSDVVKQVAYALSTYERGDSIELAPFGDLLRKK